MFHAGREHATFGARRLGFDHFDYHLKGVHYGSCKVDADRLIKEAYARCFELRIEPPSRKQLQRFASSALHRFEELPA